MKVSKFIKNFDTKCKKTTNKTPFLYSSKEK